MNKIFASIVFIAVIAGISCNPVRRIDMVNDTNDSAEFVWNLDKEKLLGNPFLISNSKELKFTMYPNMSKKIKMSFGAGSWTPKEVEKLVGYLTSLEINSSSKKMKIDSLPLLKDFLLARRKGIGGAKIEIVVSN